jgi:hypothetical protein
MEQDFAKQVDDFIQQLKAGDFLLQLAAYHLSVCRNKLIAELRFKTNEAGGMLLCSDCKKAFHKDCFHKNKARPNGYQNVCKKCLKQRHQNKKVDDA